MNVLLIGSGGREHALSRVLTQSSMLKNLYIAPGNPGTAECGINVPIADDNIPALVKFAKQKKIDLTFVGPEKPLVDGIVDAFEAAGLAIVGPNQEAARLEGSKEWAKSRMQKYGIPTAAYAAFQDYASAVLYIDDRNVYPIVIKADGLAAGKGVTVAVSRDMAVTALTDIFVHQLFGDSGASVVIEDFLSGEEASVLAFTDGKTVVPMVAAQDHKAVYDNDKGPNTGGMGAYAPAPIVTAELLKKVTSRILQPMIEGLYKDGIIYKGIIYAGLMIDHGEPSVVEFNCRFGDPETQVIVPLLKTDLLGILEAIYTGHLADIKIEWHKKSAVCVVLASGGYPGAYEKNIVISGIDAFAKSGKISLIHAGTTLSKKGELLNSAGRVLGVVAVDSSLKTAIDSAYRSISKIEFKGLHYRTDIGNKALKLN